MVNALDEMLARLRADNGLDLAAVSADGLLVGADAAEGLDAEAVCTTAGDWHLMMTAYGAELGCGEPAMLTIEFAHGTVHVTALEHGAILILVSAQVVNLGRLRAAARRFQAQYADTLVAA